MRRTLATSITVEGIALHAGKPVRMTLSPGASGTGIVFRRTDKGGAEIPARYNLVTETNLGTVISAAASGEKISIGVIEHLMSAVAGAEIDDMLVSLDGPEPPILDGDSLSYFRLLEAAGIAGVAG